jgi:hypothetical protein
MRLSIKILIVLILSATAVIAGYRLLLGRYPPPKTAVGLTALLFVTVVALDAALGW